MISFLSSFKYTRFWVCYPTSLQSMCDIAMYTQFTSFVLFAVTQSLCLYQSSLFVSGTDTNTEMLKKNSMNELKKKWKKRNKIYWCCTSKFFFFLHMSVCSVCTQKQNKWIKLHKLFLFIPFIIIHIFINVKYFDRINKKKKKIISTTM